MKDLRFAFLAAALVTGAAGASPAGDIAGTWECRLPGIEYRNKPPILYVAETGGDQSQVTIEVDGFAREIYGRSDVFAGADGWFQVKPAQGQQFMIRPEASKQKTASMGLRFADSKSDYRCLRLPPSGVPSAVIPLAPADEQSAPPVIDLGAPPEPAPSEGDAPKKE